MQFVKLFVLGIGILFIFSCDRKPLKDIEPDSLPPSQEVKSHTKEQEEKMPSEIASPHLKDWHSLLKSFYKNECEIKEKLRPIFSREAELKIMKTYLPQLYTSSLYSWFMNEIVKIFVGDPVLPSGAIHILKLETESKEAAILVASVEGIKYHSKTPVSKWHRISLVYENQHWVINKEEEIQNVANMTSRMERDVFGHLYLKKTSDIAPPAIATQTPEHVLKSLIEVARYLQNERNKQIESILPSLIQSLKPFTSQEYYQKISRHQEYTGPEIRMQVKKFEKLDTADFLKDKLNPGETCWELAIDTFRNDATKPFRQYIYYLIFYNDSNQSKLHLEMSKKIFAIPEPGPLLYNLIYWKLP